MFSPCSLSENDSDADDKYDQLMLDVDDINDGIIQQEDMCTCGSLKAHKSDCPMNSRNVYGKRLLLFSRATSFKPGSKVTVHLPRMAGKHLVCRVAQVNNGRHILHCKRGTISERLWAVNFDTVKSKERASLWTSGDRARSSQ